MSDTRKRDRAEYMRKWRAANPEKSRAATKAWRDRNPDYSREYWRKNREKLNAYQREYRRRKKLEAELNEDQ